MAIDGKVPMSPQRFCGWGGAGMGRIRCARARSKHSWRTGGRREHSPLHRWVIPYSPQREAACHRRQRPVWGRGRRDATDMKGQGPWRSLARAVDKHGQTMDLLLTEQ